LPDILDEKQKENKVYNLLRELRMSNLIINIGTDKKSLWSLNTSSKK